MIYERLITMKRTKMALINAIWGFVEKSISLSGPFIIRTIIIYKLGNEYLGLGSLFSSILQVLSLAELGFGDAVIYGMYKPVSEGDTVKLSAFLNAFKKIYSIIGSIIFIIGIIILPFLPALINGGYPDNINIYILYIIYLLNTVVSYFLFAYKESLLKANQRNDINSKILSACNIIMYIFQIIILMVFQNYYFYAVIFPLTTIFINILRSKIVDKLYPGVKCKGNLSKDEINSLVKRVIGLTLNKISYVFRNSFDSIIISAFIGLASLARYQNYYYVISAISLFMSVLATSITAGLGNSIVLETKEKNYVTYKEFLFEYSSIACIFTSCLVCVMQDFIEIWTGPDNKLPFYIVILCALYFYTMKLGDVTAVYRQAAGLWWEDRFRPVFESFLNLSVNIFLVKYWGIGGVLTSTIISIVFVNIPWASSILFKKYFEMPVIPILKQMLIYFFKMVLVSSVTFLICNYIVISNIILRFIIHGIIAVISSTAIIYLLSINKYELKLAVTRFKILLNKK